MAGFIIRLAGYALLLEAVLRIAQAVWVRDGLDGIAGLQTAHDIGLYTLYFAPIVLALVGVGPLRRPAIFIAFFLAAAALTAPFAIARVASGA